MNTITAEELNTNRIVEGYYVGENMIIEKQQMEFMSGMLSGQVNFTYIDISTVQENQELLGDMG